MTTEPEAPLGRRIAEIAFPEAATLAARVIDRYRGGEPPARGASVNRLRRKRLVPAAAAAVLLAVMVAATGLGPALASSVLSPAVARVLSTLGLSAERDATPLLVSATSSGQTVSVLAGYADSTRTVLVVQVTPSKAEPLAPTLSDGTGATLSYGGTASGALVFAPLAHPVAGANPLTLRIDTLVEFAAGKGKGSDVSHVKGSWTLRFALPYEDDAAPALSPGRLGPATVTFTGVAVSSSSVHVRFRVVGATIAELVGGPESQTTTIRYELLDPQGRSMGNMMQGNPSGKGESQEASTTVEWDVLYHRGGPGTYHLVLTWNGSRLVRDIPIH